MALTLIVCGCGDSKPTPTTPSPTSNPPVAILTRLTIGGTTSFAGIGETGQLTATATFSDGTIKNVTAEGRWLSTNPSIATVSSGGLLTIVDFGKVTVQALYQTRTASLQISATPPGTLIVSGRVREPGMSGLASVRVLERQSGASTLSDADGEFSIAGLSGLTTARYAFEKNGYEPGRLEAPPNTIVDMALQRVIRLTAGETVTPLQLAPHDTSYFVEGESCSPCRLIRVVSAAPGVLHIRLTWNSMFVTLNLWAGGQRFKGNYPEAVADLPVGAGELVVFAGMIPPPTSGVGSYVPFTIATSIR
jgi:hypothetical protein